MLVLLLLETNVARIDAVFFQRFGAGGMILEKLMANIVEIADERDRDAEFIEVIADVGHGGGGFVPVDGDAHELQPARASAATWATVEATSAVSVLVIACTTIGAPPPRSRRAFSGANRHGAGLAPRGGLRRNRAGREGSEVGMSSIASLFMM